MSRPEVPRPLLDFLALYERGAYWESHEVLEEAWRDGRSELYHGLILLASAFVHVRRGNPRGIRAQLAKTARALAPFPDAYLGLDLGTIRRGVERLRERAEGEAGAGGWEERLPHLPLPLDAARLRGDEPELPRDPAAGD